MPKEKHRLPANFGSFPILGGVTRIQSGWVNTVYFL